MLTLDVFTIASNTETPEKAAHLWLRMIPTKHQRYVILNSDHLIDIFIIDIDIVGHFDRVNHFQRH